MSSSFADLLEEKLGKHNPEDVKYYKIYNFIFIDIFIQIEEIILDEIINIDKLTDDIQSTIEKYTQLIHLSMNNMGLTSLEKFPKLKELQIVS